MRLPPHVTPARDFENFTLHDVEKGLDKLAMIVDIHGQQYLPLFEHLLNERERMLNQNSTLGIALNRAKNLRQNATHFDTHNVIH